MGVTYWTTNMQREQIHTILDGIIDNAKTMAVSALEQYGLDSHGEGSTEYENSISIIVEAQRIREIVDP